MQRHLTSTVGRAGLVGELRGGIAGAMVGLGIVLPLGTLAFAALGPDAADIGVRAAFTTAIVGGLIAALIGGVVIPGSIPRTATTLIFASFVATLATDPTLRTASGLELKTILALCMLCVIGAGVLQVGFGMARFGTLIKYVPVPVVAGFMNGVAVLIAISQIGPLLGLPGLAGTGMSSIGCRLSPFPVLRLASPPPCSRGSWCDDGCAFPGRSPPSVRDGHLFRHSRADSRS